MTLWVARQAARRAPLNHLRYHSRQSKARSQDALRPHRQHVCADFGAPPLNLLRMNSRCHDRNQGTPWPRSTVPHSGVHSREPVVERDELVVNADGLW